MKKLVVMVLLSLIPLSCLAFQFPFSFWKTSGAFSATGGTVTTSGSYTIHTFTSSGTFTTSGASRDVEYLVVAGGGNGGDSRGGGGGGGGLLTGTYSSIPIGAYSVTVGAASQNSVFDSPTAVTAIAGGAGGSTADQSGSNGGSGGGSGISTTTPDVISGGSGVVGPPRQGWYGGSSTYDTDLEQEGGNGTGGGAGAPGAEFSTEGVGLASSISGASVTYSAGGGQLIEQTANSGNGGDYGGEAGSSGIVIVRYLTP